MFPCDIGGCREPSVRGDGDCIPCNKHACALHTDHGCPKWEEIESFETAATRARQLELTALFKKINIGALASDASKLRDGVPCSIAPLSFNEKEMNSFMGGMNFHIDIPFEDGVVWLARIRRCNVSSPPPDLRDFIFRSEVATLKFLGTTRVPAQRVHGFKLEGEDNPVGVSYMLIDKLPGKSLTWSISAEQKTKVMRQLADCFIELKKHPFQEMGSLKLENGAIKIGPFAREFLTDYTKSGAMCLTGPCTSMKEYYSSYIHLILDLILRKELFPSRSIDAYISHLFFLESLPAIFLDHSKIDDGKFYLRHADDKGDQILVDDDYNITGIIDWEWAFTSSKATTFNSPIFLLHSNEFFNGSVQLWDDELEFSKILEEKGHNDLAEAVRIGKAYNFLSFCCGYWGILCDWEGYVGIFNGLRRAMGEEDMDWATWKQAALIRYRDDIGLKRLLSE